MADLARRRGESEVARHWQERSDRLRERVEQRFWMPERNFYGIAIDGDGELCRVRASNPGHLLFVGLPSPERAAMTAAQLLGPAFSTGWGMRTLAEGEARYNPMSYHNGSVWPHDTALCAAGIARSGDRHGAVRLLRAVFETATHFDMRLPELFCGFSRAQGTTPVSYPVACLPQAWAAGSAFMLLKSCLGVSIDGWRNEIHVTHPHLPSGIEQVALRGLGIGACCVDLVFQRLNGRVIVFVEGPEADRVPLRIRGL
jgi:glycogen debranching enzyme